MMLIVHGPFMKYLGTVFGLLHHGCFSANYIKIRLVKSLNFSIPAFCSLLTILILDMGNFFEVHNQIYIQDLKLFFIPMFPQHI